MNSMEWGPNPRLMSIVTADGVSACRKTLLRHRFRDGFVVIQSGVDQLMVEVMDGQERPPAKLRTNLQMMGLDMSKGTLLVYDGSRADLYKVWGVEWMVTRLCASSWSPEFHIDARSLRTLTLSRVGPLRPRQGLWRYTTTRCSVQRRTGSRYGGTLTGSTGG